MRRLLLVPLALLLALAGCSDDDGDDDGDRRTERASAEELAAACDTLTDEDVSALAGVPVKREDEDVFGSITCTYYDQTNDDPGNGVLTVLVVPDDGSFDSLEELAGPPSDELESEPLDVPGADEAIVVDDDGAGLGTTSLLARGDGLAFTAYPTGLSRADEVRVGTAALGLLFGGEPDPEAAAVDRTQVPHPCEQLTAQEVDAALDTAATARRSDVASTRTCQYSGPGVSFSLVDLGRTQRADNAVSATSDGTPEEVDAPAPLVAFAAPSPSGAGVQVAVATDTTVLLIQLRDGDQDLAEALLPALVP